MLFFLKPPPAPRLSGGEGERQGAIRVFGMYHVGGDER